MLADRIDHELRGRDEPQYRGKTVKQPLLKRSSIHARP
jgi:hypothetical protein